MKQKTWLRRAMAAALAFLTAMALLMDFAPNEINRLDVYGLTGYLYKLLHIIRLTAEKNAIVFPLLWAALACAYNHCFFRRGARWGGHALSALLAGLMLLSRCVGVRGMLPWRECRDLGGTIAVMWSNADQLIKSAIFLIGAWAGCVAMIHGLEAFAQKFAGDTQCLSLRHPFLTPLVVMALVWLPQLVIRYPGVLHFDTGWTINEYLGIFPLTTHHTPFFTIASGWLFSLGKQLGGTKIGMLLMTLILMACMLCALAHALSTAQRLRVSKKLGYGMLAIFCLQPMYSHYATWVSKDSFYTAALLLTITQMIVLCMGSPATAPSLKDLLLLAFGGTMAVLTRKNGLYVIFASMLCAAAALLASRRRKAGLAVAGCLAVTLALSQAVTGALLAAYDFEPGSRREAFSVPFQQTARVALLHGEELTLQERQVIQAVLDIETITKEYDAELADPVKETFHDEAPSQALTNYLRLWLRQALRYPVEYVDASVNLSRELYDPTLQEIEFYEKSSFHNLDGDEVAPRHKESPFYMLNETLMEFYYMAAAVLSVNLGLCTFLALMAGYLLLRSRGLRLRAVACLPVYLTMAVILLSPITETRYGLPICLGLPLMLALLTFPCGDGLPMEQNL